MNDKSTAVSTRSSRRNLPISIIALSFASVVAGCATTGSTFGSGLGEKYVDTPPYYSGSRSAAAGARVAHLPVSYQPGASQSPLFDPEGGPGSSVALLLGDMDAFLDSLAISRPLPLGNFGGSTGPDVRFGCDPTPFGECASDSEETSVQGAPWMKLAVGRPSEAWTTALRHALADAAADQALVITLEIGQYWTHQKNLRGDKEVYLGAGHSERLPWLTSLDQPVQVLQLTGALVDRNGKAIRIGAEGLLARPTPIVASGLGFQALIQEDDVERIRTMRRDDLHGAPLAWQIALQNLVAQLTGQGLMDIR